MPATQAAPCQECQHEQREGAAQHEEHLRLHSEGEADERPGKEQGSEVRGPSRHRQ